jgi:hypothetical protein
MGANGDCGAFWGRATDFRDGKHAVSGSHANYAITLYTAQQFATECSGRGHVPTANRAGKTYGYRNSLSYDGYTAAHNGDPSGKHACTECGD